MRGYPFVAALVFSTPAMATSQWFMVTPATSNPEAVQMADAASIKTNGRYLEVWTHLFYYEPVEGVKSYMMQYDVDCQERMTRKKRYIDYDAKLKLLDSGDYSNSVEEKFRSMAPSTIGDLIVNFTCSNSTDKKRKFLAVAENVDYRQIAEFYLERGELVTTRIEEKAQ